MNFQKKDLSSSAIKVVCQKKYFLLFSPASPALSCALNNSPSWKMRANVAYIYIYFPPLAPPVAVLKLFLGVVVVSVGLGLGRRVVENTVPGRSSH